ncbi:hypothetical protein AGMMS50229_18740 [Campylobacterota bacterium]|nr:hypothetical protein AGMMS50229_18740 [Campylobacterota bacterium]
MAGVEIIGLDKLQKTIAGLVKATGDINGIAHEIANVIKNAAAESIREQKSAVDGTKYHDLSPAYKARKLKKYGKRVKDKDGKTVKRQLILVRTGNLEKITTRRSEEESNTKVPLRLSMTGCVVLKRS